MIPYGKQSISPADVVAVTETLTSGWLTTGPRVAEFEERFAEHVGAKFAVAVNNGTSALHLAMLVGNIGSGHRVVTSPNTFLASANCAVFVGATPDFCDVDSKSYNLCPDKLRLGWKGDTRAVVAVDYAGQSCDMPAIHRVASDRGAIVIEDACHAVGGRFEHEGRVWNVGGHPWADMTTFSFHPVKSMTTGEGGMLVTDNAEYAARARVLRQHGMTRESDDFVGLGAGIADEFGPWYYEMHEVGHNFRITDFQCALGLSQLDRLGEFTQRRREIVQEYNRALLGTEFLSIPKLRNAKDREHISWHLYTVQIDFDRLKTTRTELMHALAKAGVGTQVLYIPVHLQPWYREAYGYRAGQFPIAEEHYKKALSLPLYPAMTSEEVGTVISTVKQLVRAKAS